MDFVSSLYHRNSDTFYTTATYLNPIDLLHLSSCSRLLRRLLYGCDHRNLWFQWWQRNVSQVVLPIGTLETMIQEVIKLSRDELTTITGETTKHLIYRGYDKLVLKRISCPADCDYILDSVIAAGYTHLFCSLIERGLIIDPNDLYVLCCAITSRVPLDMLNKLLSYGFDLAESSLPLLYAIGTDCAAIVECLIAHGAKIKTRERDLLRRACRNFEVFQVLIRHGIDPRPYLEDLLIVDLHFDLHFDILKYLVETYEIPSKLKNRYLRDCVHDDRLEAVRLLLHHGAEITEGIPYSAVLTDNIKMVRLIHQHGGHYNDVDITYASPEITKYITSHSDAIK